MSINNNDEEMKNVETPSNMNTDTVVENKEEQMGLQDSKKATKCLLVLNLQRPFVSSALESLLSAYGKVDKFWLDSIKTHCYVQYETEEVAANAKEKLNGVKWPSEGKKLIVDFVPEEDIDYAISKKQSPYEEKEKEKSGPANLSLPNIQPLKPKNQDVNNQDNNKPSNEPVKTLDNLFKKTQTKPHIYYLPLTEEEVQEKKNKLKNKI